MSVMPAIPALTGLPASGGALIASPSSVLREQILHRLNGRCLPVQQAQGGAEALAKLEKRSWQVLFLDRRLPDLDPEELRTIIQQRFPGIPVVMLDSEQEQADGDEGANPATPYASAAVRYPSQQAREADRATLLSMPISPRGPMPGGLPGMIGSSEAMQRVYRLVRLVA